MSQISVNIANSGGVVPPSGGGTGVVNPPAHTLPVAEGALPFHFLGPLTNGQLLIGSTGADPVPATITAGAGITITNSAGGIQIDNTGAGFTWNNVAGTSATMAAENGYLSNNAGLVTLTLPAVAAFGDTFAVAGIGAGGWLIAQNAGQIIRLGSSFTTIGVGGSLASSNRYDQLEILCVVANTTFIVRNSVGNITIV